MPGEAVAAQGVAAVLGYYGKVPTNGDFVLRRLPRSFVDPWDAWLQRAMAISREQLAEGDALILRQLRGNTNFIELRGDGGAYGHSYFHDNPAVSSDIFLSVRFKRPPGEDSGRPLESRRSRESRFATARRSSCRRCRDGRPWPPLRPVGSPRSCTAAVCWSRRTSGGSRRLARKSGRTRTARHIQRRFG